MHTGILKIDGHKLWDLLDDAHLLDVQLSQMDAYQISTLAEIISICVHGHTPSFWTEYRDGTRVITTPITAPHNEKTYLAKDGRKALHDLLERLGATPDEYRRYGFTE